jgi:hypothetical protein
MKKIAVILIATTVAGAAFADIAVNFKTTAPLSNTAAAGGGYLQSDTVAILVWSATDTTGDAVDETGLAVGEIALKTTVATSAGVVVPSILEIYDFVGINDGYMFARLFQDTSISAGDYYVETGLIGAGLTDYDENTPTTQYIDSFNSTAMDIDSQGLQVIPEPATIGLMGIAGLGMFLARRKVRR